MNNRLGCRYRNNNKFIILYYQVCELNSSLSLAPTNIYNKFPIIQIFDGKMSFPISYNNIFVLRTTSTQFSVVTWARAICNKSIISFEWIQSVLVTLSDFPKAAKLDLWSRKHLFGNTIAAFEWNTVATWDVGMLSSTQYILPH